MLCQKTLSSQSYGFPVVMCGCESWTVKKAERRRIDAFELWCWRRLLRVPWTARRFNQSMFKEISPESSLEGLMLKLKFQYFGHLMQRADSFEKTLMLGMIETRREGDNRGWDGWMASPTRWTWVWVNSGSWWWTGRPGVLWFMGSQRVGHDWATELWTDSYNKIISPKCTPEGIHQDNNQTQWDIRTHILTDFMWSLKCGFQHSNWSVRYQMQPQGRAIFA